MFINPVYYGKNLEIMKMNDYTIIENDSIVFEFNNARIFSDINYPSNNLIKVKRLTFGYTSFDDSHREITGVYEDDSDIVIGVVLIENAELTISPFSSIMEILRGRSSDKRNFISVIYLTGNASITIIDYQHFNEKQTYIFRDGLWTPKKEIVNKNINMSIGRENESFSSSY